MRSVYSRQTDAGKRVIASVLVIALNLSSTGIVFAQNDVAENSTIGSPATEPTNTIEESASSESATPASLDPLPSTDELVDITDGPSTPASDPAVPDKETLKESELKPEKINPPAEPESLIGDPSGTPSAALPSLFTYQTIAPKADKSTGALTQSIPLDVPPGRNGLTPSVALQYNNQTAVDSIVGYGWTLSIPYIERLNKTGTDKLYVDSYFNTSVSGELVNTSTSTGAYRARVDDGSFLRYYFSNNTWTVYDKNGTRYLYGATSQSQLYDVSSTTRIGRWMLEEVRDTNNNYIKYTYTKIANQIYPSQITYTGNGVTDGSMTVTFVVDSRPDPFVSYGFGFESSTTKRVIEVDAEIGGQLSKKYVLNYIAGNNGYRSLLSSIQETGYDSAGVGTTLPAMTFTYSNAPVTWDLSTSLGYAIPNQAYVPADNHGDGINDVNALYLNPINLWLYGYLNGTSYTINSNPAFYAPDYWATNSQSGFVPQERGVRYFDVNGDGKADIIIGLDGATTSKKLYHNTYDRDTNPYGYTSVTASGTVPAFAQFNGVRYFTTSLIGNINGDGLVDVERATSADGVYAPNGSYMGSGTGWYFATSTYAPPNGSYVTDANGGDMSNPQLLDVNNDDLDDWIYTTQNNQWQSNGVTQACLNTGSAWQSSCDPNFVIATTTLYFDGIGGYWERGVRFMDINVDGLPDMVRSYSDYTTGGYSGPEGFGSFSVVLLNTGHGWVATSSVSLQKTIAKYVNDSLIERNEYVDWNGDTSPDVFPFTNTTRRQDILKSITYPSGGSDSITYAWTTQTSLNPRLPFSLQVVAAIGTNDGFGNIATTTYQYDNGLQDISQGARDRKFAGFADIIETSSDRIIKTFFHQNTGASSTIGKVTDSFAQIQWPFRQDILTLGGTLLKRTFSVATTTNLAGGSYLVTKLYDLVQDFDSAGNAHRDRAVTYAYSSTTGDLLQAVDFGEVTGYSDATYSDIGSDTRTTALSFAASTTVNISRPYLITVTNASGTKVRETRRYFDNLALGSIGIGNETKTEEWKTGSSYASTTRVYSTYGLVTQSKDGKGNATSYTYDSFNLYVATSTDATSQSTTYTYDYGSGKVATTTDPNGLVTATVSDGLGRPVLLRQPDLTTPSALVTKSSFTYVDNTLPISARRIDYLNSATSTDTYRYSDGLGRLIQERKTAEAANAFVVRDTTYALNGMRASESLPYLSANASYTSPTTTTQLFTTYTYDALRRPTAIATAVGSTAHAYAPWKVTTTDPNGSVHDYLKDAFENLVQVNEYLATSTYSTTYTYDALNNLTNITDALGNIRNFTHDGLSRRLTAQDLHAPADGTFGTWTYAYDDAGNLTQSVDPKSQTTNYTYDALNRPLTEDYTGTSGTEVTYTYDSCTNGKTRLCIASSTAARYQYTYNPLGLTATDTVTIIGTTTSFASGYTYDRQGNQTLIVYPDNTQARYLYNATGQLDSVQAKEWGASFANILSNIDYAPTGQPTLLVFANGATTTNTYDPAALYRLLSKVSTLPNAQKAQDLTYTYDPVGNITRIVDASAVATAKTMDYTYDALSRLLTASSTGATSGGDYRYSYSYDALGNILSSPFGTYTYAGTSYANPHAVTSISGGTTGPSTSTPAYIQSAIDWANGSATLPSPVTTGNTIIVGLTAFSETAIPSNNITDNKGNTYTKLGEAMNGNDRAAIFYAKNVTGGSSFTVSSAIYNTISVHEYSGLATSSPFDKVATSSGSSNTPSSGNVTTTVDNELAFAAAWSMIHNDTWTAGSGYTKRQEQIDNNNYERGASEDRVLTTATTTAATFTTGGSDLWAMAVATFKPLVTTGASGTSTTYTYDNNGNLTAASPWSYAWDYRNRLTSAGNGTATSTYTYDHTTARVKTLESGMTTFFPSKYFNTTGATSTRYIYALGLPVATIDKTPGLPSGLSTSTPAHVQSAVATSGAVTLPSAVTSGNLVAVALTVWSTTAIPTNAISDNKGNTYTRINETSNGDDHIALFYAKNVTGGSSFTVSSSLGGSISAHEYSGVATSSPLDKNAKASGSGTALSSSLATTTLGNELYFGAAWSTVTNDTWTPGAGYTLRTQVIDNDWVERHASEDMVLMTGSTTAARFTVPTSGAWVAALATFKPLVSTTTGSAATSTTRFLFADHLGSTQVVTSATGTVVQTLDYYPYGSQRISSSVGGVDAKRRFIGEYADATGLSFLNARYYDEGRGQFLSEDPVFLGDPRQQNLTNPQSLNSYSYANDNPINLSDPNGRAASLSHVISNLQSVLQSLQSYLNGVSGGGGNVSLSVSSGNRMPTPTMTAVTEPMRHETWDPVTDKRIAQLDSRVQQPATNFINDTQDWTGTTLRVNEGYRSIADQNATYAKGRDAHGNIVDLSKVVSYAKGGQSYHNYGKAIDVVMITNGQPDWGQPITPEIASYGTAQGFEWGGSWSGTFQDYPHFEMPLGQVITK